MQELLATDIMALLIDIWHEVHLFSPYTTFSSYFRGAIILGIQYLTFQAFPIIFQDGHGFNVQETGLSFLGMGIGLFIGLAFQPLFNR